MGKGSNILAQLRQLAGLGLAPEVFVYEAMPVVGELLAGAPCAFLWLDARALIANCCCRPLAPPTCAAAVAGSPAGASLSQARASDRSFKRRILAAGADREVLDFEFALPRGGAAALCIAAPTARARSDGTMRDAVQGAIRYLAMGADSSGDTPDIPLSAGSSAQEELLVCDIDGRMAQASEGAGTLLVFATANHVSPATLPLIRRDAERFLARLCEGAARHNASARMTCVHRTVWGRFSFDVFGLGAGGGRRLFAVKVQRHAPAKLQMLRSIGTAVSLKQRETALMIADGLSNREIACALGISRNTAAYHVKCVFAKMSVHSRQELLTRLLAMSGAASA